MENNVVLITIDSLRSDFVGHLGSENGCTPNIDSVAADGLSCSRAYANGIPTYFAFRSILAGRSDILDDEPIGIPMEWQTVADVFSSHGYDTAAFNAANPWLTADFNYDSGFDTFVDFLGDESDDGVAGALVEVMQDLQHRFPEDGLLRDKLGLAARAFCSVFDNYPIESAETVTREAIDWLSERSEDRSFFLWVHYMDPHYPWTPASNEVSSWEIARMWHEVAHVYNGSDQRPNESIVDTVHDLYGTEVRNVDSAIGTILDHIHRGEAGENVVCCITSDHGTEIGDHGGFSHGPDSLYEEIVQVPLVVSGPGIPQKTISDPVQHVDIPSTLIDAADLTPIVPEVERGWAGTPLDQCRRDVAFIQVVYDYDPAVSTEPETGVLNAVVEYPWKLHWNEHSDTVELYDLEEDPNEFDDLTESHQGKVESLKQTIRSMQDTAEVDHRTGDEILRVRRQARRMDMP